MPNSSLGSWCMTFRRLSAQQEAQEGPDTAEWSSAESRADRAAHRRWAEMDGRRGGAQRLG